MTPFLYGSVGGLFRPVGTVGRMGGFLVNGGTSVQGVNLGCGESGVPPFAEQVFIL